MTKKFYACQSEVCRKFINLKAANASSIIEYNNKIYIIVGFDHDNFEVELQRWRQAISTEAILFFKNLNPLKAEIRINIKDFYNKTNILLFF